MSQNAKEQYDCFRCVDGAVDQAPPAVCMGCMDLGGDGRNRWKPIPEWHLDLFSTIMSRRHSFHMVMGKQRYVKTKYEGR